MALAVLGLDWAGLSGAPSLAVPPRGGRLAAAGGGARRSPSPTLRRWQRLPQRCADGGGAGRALSGAGTGGAGQPRSPAGASTGRRSAARASAAAAAAAASHPLSLGFPLASLLSFLPLRLRSSGLPGSCHGGAQALRVSGEHGCVHFPRPGKTSSPPRPAPVLPPPALRREPQSGK